MISCCRIVLFCSKNVKYALAVILWMLCSMAFAQKLSYSFKKKTLSEVLEKVGADNHVKIAFDAQLADNQLVSGYFKGISVDELIHAILSTGRFEMERIGPVCVVKPRKADDAAVASTLSTVNLRWNYLVIRYGVLLLIKKQGRNSLMPIFTPKIRSTQ